jgi:DNA-binding SARP family transcriptional activator
VLLSYLEARLVDAVGATAAREEHGRAALLLEREGLTEDAAAAFAKAENWEGVARTLGHPAGSAAGLGGAWLEALPPTVVETDSLLLMARAHRALASGALADAVVTMRAAEEVAASTVVAEQCRLERDRVVAWMSSQRPVGSDWLAVVRGATQRQPREAQRTAAALPGATGRFAEGAAAFLAGDMLAAARILRGVSSHPDASPAMATGARLTAAVAGSFCGRVPDAEDLDRLRDEVEEAGIPWLDRMARVALAVGDVDSGEVLDNLSDACQREGDRWGEGLVGLMAGIGSLSRRGAGVAQLERAARIFGEVGAGVFETSALGYLALSAQAAGDVELATKAAHQARTLASLLEVPGSAGLAALALGRLFDDDRELGRARELLEPLGTWEWHQSLGLLQASSPVPGPEPGMRSRRGADPAPPPAPVQLRCFGGFALAIGGRPFDESAAKPMERALLHLLAMRAGEQVHREDLIEALWPEADPDAGLHRLQVAVSSLRRLLVPDPQVHPRFLVREGDSYRLFLPDDADVDIWEVEAQLRRANAARTAGHAAAEEEALTAALSAYGGPLLPGDGPADWVVRRRATFQAAVVDAAGRLATLRLGKGEHQAAAETARVGLSLDRYRDELWRLLIEAADRSGHQAEAGQARRAYAAMLEELGV